MTFPTIQPPNDKIQVGSTIIWRGQKNLFTVLSFLIGLKDPVWRELSLTFQDGTTGKPWHMGQVVAWDDDDGWIVDESRAPTSRQVPLTECGASYIVVNWFKHSAREYKCNQFLKEYAGCKYDAWAYVWTAFDKLLGFDFKVEDRKHTCWERNACFNLWMGNPWCSSYDWPYLPDFIYKWLDQRDASQRIAIVKE